MHTIKQIHLDCNGLGWRARRSGVLHLRPICPFNRPEKQTVQAASQSLCFAQLNLASNFGKLNLALYVGQLNLAK